MAAGSHFGFPKITLYRIFYHFRTIPQLLWNLDVRKSLSVAFLAISEQYKTFFLNFVQNGRRRLFWIFKIHFRSHFWPFQIDTQLEFLKFLFLWKLFYKMAAGGHFGCQKNHFWSHFWPFQINTKLTIAVGHFECPKFTLDHISGHFRSIQLFYFLNFFLQNGCRWPFWMSEITFDLISGHFRSIRNFNFLTKWLPSAILDVWNSLWITFLAILDQYYFLFFFTKWLTSAILDVRNSLLIAFLAISDRYATLFFLEFLTKWLPSAILDVRNSFSIAFLAISDRSAILDFRNSLSIAILAILDFFSGGHFGCLKITLDRISGHFRLIGHFGFPKFTFDRNSGHSGIFFRWPFWMSEIHFRSHFWPFQIDTQLFFVWNFLTKWPAAAILDGTTMSIIELVRDIWMSNACVKFEERTGSLNP